MISKITDNFHVVVSFQKYIWKQLQFLSHWNNMEKNGTLSLFETSVNGNMAFAYMTFHCTSVLGKIM